MAGRLKSIFGEITWIPPAWLQRASAHSIILTGTAVIAVAVLVLVGIRHYLSLPQPPGVVAAAVAPGVSRIVDDELEIMPLAVDFSVVADPRIPMETVDSVARLDLVGQTLDTGIGLAPDVPGRWHWQSETRLIFEPDVDWPAGQTYTVHFGESIFAPGLRFRDDTAEFVTPAFAASIDEFVYYQNPVDRADRRLVATLSFSHPVDAERLADEVTLAMPDSGETVRQTTRSVSLAVELDRHQRTAYVRSEPVPLPPISQYTTLSVDGGLAPTSGSSRLSEVVTRNILIPDAASFFRVSNVNSIVARGEDDEAFQSLTMEFTDRVAVKALEEKLRAYVLPKDVVQQGRTRRNVRWSSPREVTADVLSQAQPVDVSLNEVADDFAQFHSATLDVPEGRFVYVVIDEGLSSEGGFTLSRTFDTVLRAPSYPKGGEHCPIRGDPAVDRLAPAHVRVAGRADTEGGGGPHHRRRLEPPGQPVRR